MAVHLIGTDGNTNITIGGVWNHPSTAWLPSPALTQLLILGMIKPDSPFSAVGPGGVSHLVHHSSGTFSAGTWLLYVISDGTIILDMKGPTTTRVMIVNPCLVAGVENWLAAWWDAATDSMGFMRNGVIVPSVIRNWEASDGPIASMPSHLLASPLEIGAASGADQFCMAGIYAEWAFCRSVNTNAQRLAYSRDHISPNQLSLSGQIEYVPLATLTNPVAGATWGAGHYDTLRTPGIWTGTNYGLATQTYNFGGGAYTAPYQGVFGGTAAAHPTLGSLITPTPKYFVKTGGNNALDGLSDANAWADLAKVNTVTLVPGDVVGFRGGDTFVGATPPSVMPAVTQFEIKGALHPIIPSGGDPDNPIIFTSYGTGRATIHAARYTSGINLWSVAGVEVKNLIVTGSPAHDHADPPGGPANNLAFGISVLHYDVIGSASILRHIVVDDCEVSGFMTGIMVQGDPGANGFAYDDVKIRRCFTHHNVASGIDVESVYQLIHQPMAQILTNVLVQDCVSNDNPGSIAGDIFVYTPQGNGIVLIGVDGGVIERCTAGRNGWNYSADAGGPGGLEATYCANITIQYSEAYETGRAGVTTGDGGGIDLDLYCHNCIVQYNYTHDNLSGGLMLFGAFAADVATQSCVFRYNISEDDCVNEPGVTGGSGSIRVHASQGGLFYGNTVFARAGTARCAVDLRNTCTGIKFFNNLLITSGAGGLLFRVNPNSLTGFEARGNAYWQINDGGSTFRALVNGVTYTSLVAFRTAPGLGLETGTGFNLDPLLVDPGNGGTVNNPPGLAAALTAYQLQSGSPIAGQGLDLDPLFPYPPATSPGLVDFYNNTLPLSGPTTLGASLVTGSVVPPNPITPPEAPRNFVSTLPSTLLTGGTVKFCHVGEDVQAAMNGCVNGDVLVLDDGAVWVGEVFPPDRPGSGWITICSASAFAGTLTPGVQVTRADAPKMAHLRTEAPTNLLTCAHGGYRFIGLELSSNYVHPSNIIFNLVVLGYSATRFSMERCWVHGRLASELGTDSGIRHAVTVDAADVQIHECRVDGLAEAGSQVQAIFTANSPGPILLDNNFLEAPGECVLFGGDDPVDVGRVPSDIIITHNTLSWNIDWWPLTQATGWGDLRNLLELKNARRVKIEGNTFQNCWGSNVLFTPRNQSGNAPACTVEDVMFRSNRLFGYTPPGEFGASGFLVTIATDDMQGRPPGTFSGTMARIAIINNLMTGCDIEFWNHTDQRARMSDMWVEHNTVLPCRYRGTTVGLVTPLPGNQIGGFLRARVANNVFGFGDVGSGWLGPASTDTFTFQSVINRNVVVYVPPGLGINLDTGAPILGDQGGPSRAVPPAVVYPQGWFIDPPNAQGLDVTTGIITPGSAMLTFGCDMNGVADGTPVGVDHDALNAALAGGIQPEPPTRKRAKGFRASSIRT